MTKKPTYTDLRDALSLAESMLTIIEKGGSFSSSAWYERTLRIRDTLAAAQDQRRAS